MPGTILEHMNIRLNLVELFYYVNRYGGFEQAARKLPYGIQPTTIRRQLCELEKLVGQRLYDRRPFKLTSVGENVLVSTNAIFEIVEDLKGKIERWRTAGPETFRIGASTIVLRDHLPALLPTLQRDFPELRLKFKEGLPSQIEGWLKERSIDVAITLSDGEIPAGLRASVVRHLLATR